MVTDGSRPDRVVVRRPRRRTVLTVAHPTGPLVGIEAIGRAVARTCEDPPAGEVSVAVAGGLAAAGVALGGAAVVALVMGQPLFLLMAGVGVAGSTRVGDGAILAGHVGVTDHLNIGAGARVAAKSAVFGDVEPGISISGHPARPHRQFLRAQAALYRLAPIVAELERLVTERERRDG